MCLRKIWGLKMKRNPLILISCSRSGSSMLAGIFAHHGYWVGTCRKPDKYNAKGYFENLPIKKCMNGYFNDNIHEANKGNIYDIDATDVTQFRRMVEGVVKRDGYVDDGSPWLVKFGALYYNAWEKCYPPATTVCLFRAPESIIASGKRSFLVSKARVKAQTLLMEDVLSENPSAFRVDFEELIRGNYSQLVPICVKEGFEPDTDWIDEFIYPSLVHA